jgi:hypothetical protein
LIASEPSLQQPGKWLLHNTFMVLRFTGVARADIATLTFD